VTVDVEARTKTGQVATKSVTKTIPMAPAAVLRYGEAMAVR
jgi:hypothetical protein